MRIDNTHSILTTGFTVNRKAEVVGFDLLLPPDCKKVTGVVALAGVPDSVLSMLDQKGVSASSSGNLNLRWSSKGAIFLQYPVSLHHHLSPDRAWTGEPNLYQNLEASGYFHQEKIIHPLKVDLPGEEKLLAGVYKDSILSTLTQNLSYRVDLYLYYQRQ